MDALVPMASQPTEMSSRNLMLRRMLIEMVRNDPAYRDGHYVSQPSSLHFYNAFFALATLCAYMIALICQGTNSFCP